MHSQHSYAATVTYMNTWTTYASYSAHDLSLLTQFINKLFVYNS